MPAPPDKTPPSLGRRFLLLLYSRKFTNYFLLFTAVAGFAGWYFLWPKIERRLWPPPAPVRPTEEAPAPAALPFDSPEYLAQRALADYLRQNEPFRLKTLADMNPNRRQIAERINQQQSVGSVTELANSLLYLLLNYPPRREDFLPMLDQTARLLSRAPGNDALLDAIFSQASLFTPENPGVWQLRFVESAHKLNRGDAQAALDNLWSIENSESAPLAARATAALQAGLWLEGMGEPVEALARYQAAGAWLAPDNASAIEAVSRASWLALELRDTASALDDLSLLRALPTTAENRTEFSPVLADLLAFTSDPAVANAYWARGQAWWPRWRALAQSLGAGQAPERAGPQSHPNLPALSQAARSALEIRSSERYFDALDLLLAAARWRPADAEIAIVMIYQGVTLAPAQADELFSIADALAAALPPSPERNASILNLRVSALLELNRNAEALALASTALAGTVPPPPRLAVLHAMATLRTGREREDAAARIAALLASDPDAAASIRASRVALLSDLQISLGREDEARRLLETETQAARQNGAGADIVSQLEQQLARLQGREVLTAALSLSLPDWLSKFGPPWFSYASTPAQAGRLTGLDSPPAVAARQFALALNPAGPLPARGKALEAALNAYPYLPLTGWELGQGALDFARREDVPLALRQYGYGNALWRLAQTGQRSAVAQLLADAPPDMLPVLDRRNYDRWLEYLAVPATSEAQIEFSAKFFGMEMLNVTDLVLASRIIETLARLGDYDAAELMRSRLESANLSSAALPLYRELREHLRNYIANYRAMQPVTEALRKLVLEAMPQAGDTPPPRWMELNAGDRLDLDLLTLAEAREGLAVVIRDRLSYGDHPFQAFFDFTNALPRDPAGLTLRWEIFALAQQLAERDPDRARAAQFAMLVNFDDPALAERGQAALAPSDNPARFPQASAFIQFYQKLFNWRSGVLAGAAEFPGGAGRGADASQLRFALAFAVQRGDVAQVERMLVAQPEAAFLRMPVLPVYLDALRLAGGRDAALARAADVARAEIAVAVVNSWWRPSREAAQPVFDLARALRDPATCPREWVDYLLAHVRNENSADLIRLFDAELQRDWPAVLAASGAFLARNPTFYDYYWQQAQALAELGRRREAVAPLRLFVSHAHNEPGHATATALLRQLETEFPAPAAP